MFWNRKKKEPARPRLAPVPTDFTQCLDLFLHMGTFSFCSEILLSLYEEDHPGIPKGTIHFSFLERDTFFNSLIQSGHPATYDYIYNNPDFTYTRTKDGYLYISRDFYAPDSFLFTATEEQFLSWARIASPTAYQWGHWNLGEPRHIRITYSEYSSEMRFYRWDIFDRKLSKK